MTITDPLAQLHDIHLPHTINWEAIPWGKYLLIFLLLFAASAGVIWLISHYRQKKTFRREALARLTKIEQQFQQNQNPQQLIIACNQLLRRLCLTLYPTEQVASLTGQAWLEFLTQQSKKNKNFFNSIEKKLLTDEIYQVEISLVNTEVFIKDIRLWIQEK